MKVYVVEGVGGQYEEYYNTMRNTSFSNLPDESWAAPSRKPAVRQRS